LHRAFNRKPVWQRCVIVVAGPLANLALAVLLYSVVNWAGVEELRPWFSQPRAGSLVDKAGMIARDEVVAMRPLAADADTAWMPIRSMTDLQWRLTQAALKGQDLAVRVRSEAVPGRADGRERELHWPMSQVPTSEVDSQLMDHIGLTGPYSDPVIDRVVAGGPAAKAGLRHGDWVESINGQAPPDAGFLFKVIRASHDQQRPLPLAMRIRRGSDVLDLTVTPVMQDVQGELVPRIQAALGSELATVTVRYGLLEGITLALDKTWDVSRLSLSMLGKMLVGQASIRNLSGPLTIADYAGRSARLGWVYYIGFLALVSVSLGVLNLLPLPVLDGGHLMYYLFEGVTGRPVSQRWLERLQRGGVAIMLMMMSLALYNDLARLIGAH
jgi:regulator of sigma E protease